MQSCDVCCNFSSKDVEVGAMVGACGRLEGFCEDMHRQCAVVG